MTKKLTIDPGSPQDDLIGQAARVLQNGGVIGYPTETVYGIGCNVFEDRAVNRIYQLKERDRSKAMILIAADTIQIGDLVDHIPASAEALAENFWPGPLTMVFRISPQLKDFPFVKSSTIAIRIPDCPICIALLKTCGTPIVSTSANKSGESESTTAEEVVETFGDQLDLIIDGGPTPSSKPSTVIDVSRDKVRILREGAISPLEINTVLKVL